MKTCIIFSHHYTNETVRRRLDNLKKYNSDCHVVSVGLSGYNLLHGSVIINRNLWPTNKDINIFRKTDWSLGDLCIYQTYIEYPDYDIYFLVEYDTAFNVSIFDFFPNIYTQDCGVNYGPNFDISEYMWYKNYNHRFAKIDKQHLSTTGPTTCLWFTKNLLSKIVKECFLNKGLYDNMFSELRLGTLIKKFTDIKKNRNDIDDYISFVSEAIVEKHKNFFYHPRKKIINNE